MKRIVFLFLLSLMLGHNAYASTIQTSDDCTRAKDALGNVKIISCLQHNGAKTQDSDTDAFSLVDKQGKLMNTAQYVVMADFVDDLARVAVWQDKNMKWGFIDKTGKEVIALIYDGAWNFSNHIAAVRLGDKWGYIDTKNHIVLPIEYDEVSPYPYKNQSIIGKKDTHGVVKVGLYDFTHKKLIIPMVYDNIGLRKDGTIFIKDGEKIYRWVNGKAVEY